jgi:CzcA family heavy metal efflux pump
VDQSTVIRSVLDTSLRFRYLVVAIAAGVLAVGILQLRDAPVDVLPEFTPPYVEIQTEALGLSAVEVENLITVPLEADLLNGVEAAEVIRSESLPGLSSIVLVFEPGTDVYRARQLVQERLAHAHALPRVSKPPTLLQPLSSSSRVMMVGISSDRISPIEQSVIARWTMRPRLMGVPGVANVAIWGMRDQQIQVQVDPERLRERGIELDQIVETAGNAQIVSPLSFLEASTPGSGGFIESPQQRLQVRNVLERLADPAELGKVPVDETSGSVRLSDVADIKIGHQPLIGDAVVDDHDGLLLVVEKFPGASTLEVTRGVEAALETLQPGLAGMRTDRSVFRPASFVQDAIDNLTLALIIGSALLALALVALFFQWRSVLIALVTIPLSLVSGALVLDLLGETFNAISVGGLAFALAVVVDDAVVGAENVARRMRREPDGLGVTSTTHVVRDASQEIRGPLVYVTLIALIAIVPIAVMEGRPGAFLEPLALSYVVAVVAATVVAMTVAPALSLLLFSSAAQPRRESPPLKRLRPRYDAALSRLTATLKPRVLIGIAGACVIAALAVLPLLGTSLIPSFQDRNVLVHLDAEPGTSHPRITKIATAVSRELRGLPGVESVGAHIGRAVTGDQTVDINTGQIWVSVAPSADYNETVERIEDVVGRTPRVESNVASYSAQRMREVGALGQGENQAAGDGLDVLTGSDKPLVVRVYGHDLEVLRRQAKRVRRVMSEVDGVDGARVEFPQEQPNLVIEVDLARAQRLAIKPGDVRRAEATLLQGIHVGSVFEEQKVFDVLVMGVPKTRRGIADVRNLLIDRPGGGHVRLADVADVRTEPTPVAIEREAVSRLIDVEADVSGRSVGAVAGDIRDRLASIGFPLEYHAEVLEETSGEEIDSTKMLAFVVLCAVASFLLLQAALRSWALAVLACMLLPVALVGGVFATLIGPAELSLGSLAGFVALGVLATRTSVLSIRHFQKLEQGQNEAFGHQAIWLGAQARLVPILTTALALALLVLPFVVLGPRPGLELVHPLAVVILGGLISTTLVGLFLLPALYLRLGASPRPEFDWRTVVEPPFAESEPAARSQRVPTQTTGNGRTHNGESEH